MRFLLILIWLVTAPLLSYGQRIPTYQMPSPSQYYAQGADKKAVKEAQRSFVFYGAKPAKPNGRVILFNHGFSSDFRTMLPDNAMYQKAYDAGYMTAFANTTAYEGDWVNGEILSRIIQQVAQHYQVDKMDIIAHSNGGKALEVAMFQHNKQDLVSRAITLGTPFRGTQIANVAQWRMTRWIAKLVGLHEGSQLSTTYYCDNYFRPYFDNHFRNQPHKFHSFGGYGYNNGSWAMAITGSYIRTMGGGYNDGVTPLYSAFRPNGHHLSTYLDPHANLDHTDLSKGQNIWESVIAPVLSQPVTMQYRPNSVNAASNNNAISKTAPFQEQSNYQMIFSETGYNLAVLSDREKNLKIDVIRKNSKSQLNLIDPAKKSVLKVIEAAPVSKSTATTFEDHLTSFELKNINNQKLSISGDDAFTATITSEIDKPMLYTLRKEADKTFVEISLPKLSELELNQLQVQIEFQKIGELEGTETKDQPVIVHQLKRVNDVFTAEVSHNAIGVYSMFATAEIPSEYRRNLLSGFVLEQTSKAAEETKTRVASTSMFQLSSNPVTSNTVLHAMETIEEAVYISVYNLNGQLVKNLTVEQFTDSFELGKQLSTLSKGYYLLNISSSNEKQTLKILIQP